MEFKSDIQIAQEAKPELISKIAERLSIDEEYVENYGRYKAKIDYNLLDRYADKANGKLILVTAIVFVVSFLDLLRALRRAARPVRQSAMSTIPCD